MRLRNGDCASCTASPCRSVSSNTESPVVLVKSARTIVSVSVSFGARRCCQSTSTKRNAYHEPAIGHEDQDSTHERRIAIVDRRCHFAVRDAALTAPIPIALQPLEIGPDLGCVLVPKVAILLETFLDDPFQLDRHVGIEAHRRNRRAIENPVCNDAGAVAAEWQRPGCHLVEHDTEREHIGAPVHVLRANLFRRHVRRRAEGAARTGQCVASGERRCAVGRSGWLHFREPEIENLRVSAIRHEEIRRLDVAMDDPCGVCGLQRIDDLDRK